MHHTLAGSGSEPLVLSWFGKPVGISTRAVRELLLTQAGAQETGSPSLGRRESQSPTEGARFAEGPQVEGNTKSIVPVSTSSSPGKEKTRMWGSYPGSPRQRARDSYPGIKTEQKSFSQSPIRLPRDASRAPSHAGVAPEPSACPTGSQEDRQFYLIIE